MSSTLTSADLNLSRSSTRRYAPPGGQTSISIGDGSSASGAPSPVYRKGAGVPEPKVNALPPPPPPPALPATFDGKIVIVIYAGEGSGIVLDEAKIALAKLGVTNVGVTSVAEPTNLPYTCQMLTKSSQVILALALLPNDKVGDGSLSATITSSLLQVSTVTSHPIVPGVFFAESLLAAKAVLPNLATKWAASVVQMAAISIALEVVPHTVEPPVAPIVITPEHDDINILIAHLRQSFKEHGANGIFGLGRKFKIIDDDNSGQINLAEFTKMLNEHGLGWTPAQTKLVFDRFDMDHSGSIIFDEFLVQARDPMNQRRQNLALMAFEIMDKDKSGVIDINDIRGVYNADKHPDVISHKRTADSVLREFLDTFEGGIGATKDGKITPTEFLDYYANVSASIDNDDYFELMIRNAWHISGGEGWCENSSCRRVLATHKDGRQTVEEIKNDLGIASDDKATMLNRLKSQGLDDIVDISLTGSVDSATPEPASPKPPAPSNVAVVSAGAPNAPIPRSGRRGAAGGQSSLVLG